MFKKTKFDTYNLNVGKNGINKNKNNNYVFSIVESFIEVQLSE